MKKLLPAILLLLSLKNHSQSLVLTKASNEPVSGDTKSFRRFDSSGVVPKSTGANMNWDFSAITQNTAVSSSTYVLPSSVPSSSAYAGTTLVEDQGNNSYFFYKSVSSPSTSFESLGFESSNFSLTFTNSAVGAVWPIGYGYANTDTYSGNVSQPVTGTLNGTIVTMGSGSGTIILPGGQTYTNVLQVKTVNTTTITSGSGFTTITGTISTTDYSYYHSSQKFELLTVSYQKQNLASIAGPTVTSSGSIRINNAVVVNGLNEQLLNVSLSVYPNPVSDVLNIAVTEAQISSVEIYSQLGQQVYRSVNTAKMDVSALTKGIYIVLVETDKGVVRKKFVKE
jgi:hypothetical protein